MAMLKKALTAAAGFLAVVFVVSVITGAVA